MIKRKKVSSRFMMGMRNQVHGHVPTENKMSKAEELIKEYLEQKGDGKSYSPGTVLDKLTKGQKPPKKEIGPTPGTPGETDG